MKGFLKRLTPLTGGAIAVLIAIIICGIDTVPSQGWSLIGIFYLLPLMLVMLIADSIVRVAVKGNGRRFFTIQWTILVVMVIGFLILMFL